MGVYFPAADSTLTVRDTQITAGTGIGIKGGSLVMSGDSVIHAKGENDSAGIPSTGGIAEDPRCGNLCGWRLYRPYSQR